MTQHASYEHYYVPAQSHWPAVGAVGLGTTVLEILISLHPCRIPHDGLLRDDCVSMDGSKVVGGLGEGRNDLPCAESIAVDLL